jgi:hypothetical protein
VTLGVGAAGAGESLHAASRQSVKIETRTKPHVAPSWFARATMAAACFAGVCFMGFPGI